MDMEQVFHMKGGIGENSYSKNSSLQKRVVDKAKHIIVETMEKVYVAKRPRSLGIADLGCSSGPNTLSNVKDLVEAVEAISRNTFGKPAPEFRVCLNDLPTNDFNTIFQALPDWYREVKSSAPCVYVAGYPGTFYGRLFPDNSLHFVYSSNSLHWLSKVPCGIYDEQGVSLNGKSIYITEKSPPQVHLAYHQQFQHDFSLFLKSRSEEIISGGHMVLILLGRIIPNHADIANSFFWDTLYRSFATLVAEGEVEEEKLASYDVHFYAPSMDELEEEVRKEGSFKVEVKETFEMDKDAGKFSSYGVAVAKAVRSIQESMIFHHFGEAINMDKLFRRYASIVDQEMLIQDISSITIALVLSKIST